jgi:hypothetical protein
MTIQTCMRCGRQCDEGSDEFTQWESHRSGEPLSFDAQEQPLKWEVEGEICPDCLTPEEEQAIFENYVAEMEAQHVVPAIEHPNEKAAVKGRRPRAPSKVAVSHDLRWDKVKNNPELLKEFAALIDASRPGQRRRRPPGWPASGTD